MTDLLAAWSLMAMALGFHIVCAMAGAVVLFPSLWYLFRLFKPRALFSHDGPPPRGERKTEGPHA